MVLNMICAMIRIWIVIRDWHSACCRHCRYGDCAYVQCGDHEHSHRVCVAGNFIGDAGAASLVPALREMRQLQHLDLGSKQHTGGGSCGAECAGDWVLCAGLGVMTTAHSAWVVWLGLFYIRLLVLWFVRYGLHYGPYRFWLCDWCGVFHDCWYDYPARIVFIWSACMLISMMNGIPMSILIVLWLIFCCLFWFRWRWWIRWLWVRFIFVS